MAGRIFLCLMFLCSTYCKSQMMSQQAQTASQRPAKLEITTVNAENKLGQAVPVQVKLLDGQGKLVAAPENVSAEIKVVQPSGQTSTTNVIFAPGESQKELDLSIAEPGITEMTVTQTDKRLIGGKKYVLVTPGKKAHKPKPAEKPKPDTGELRMYPMASSPKLVFAGYSASYDASYDLQSGDAGAGAAANGNGNQLMLKVSGEDADGGVRADGTTCANIQVFYMGEQAITRETLVWLKWSNGSITPNPLHLAPGATEADACWTSRYPISAATVNIVATTPRLPFIGDPASERFTENIQGIDFANPPAAISVVDNVNLTAMFYDPSGKPVKLVESRNLFFDSNSPVIQVAPQRATVTAGDFNSSPSAVLVPTFFGKSTIEVFADGYPKAAHEIKVTWLGVLLSCIIGGLLGGYLAFINSDGNLWKRIATGVIVGFLASGAYVFWGVPNLQAGIAHNQLSVVLVSGFAGFAGVKAVSAISGRLNFGF